jgi:hypothetical protein
MDRRRWTGGDRQEMNRRWTGGGEQEKMDGRI